MSENEWSDARSVHRFSLVRYAPERTGKAPVQVPMSLMGDKPLYFKKSKRCTPVCARQPWSTMHVMSGIGREKNPILRVPKNSASEVDLKLSRAEQWPSKGQSQGCGDDSPSTFSESSIFIPNCRFQAACFFSKCRMSSYMGEKLLKYVEWVFFM